MQHKTHHPAYTPSTHLLQRHPLALHRARLILRQPLRNLRPLIHKAVRGAHGVACHELANRANQRMQLVVRRALAARLCRQEKHVLGLVVHLFRVPREVAEGRERALRARHLVELVARRRRVRHPARELGVNLRGADLQRCAKQISVSLCQESSPIDGF